MRVRVVAKFLDRSLEELNALDGIRFGPVHEVDDLSASALNPLVDEMYDLYPETQKWKSITIETID